MFHFWYGKHPEQLNFCETENVLPPAHLLQQGSDYCPLVLRRGDAGRIVLPPPPSPLCQLLCNAGLPGELRIAGPGGVPTCEVPQIMQHRQRISVRWNVWYCSLASCAWQVCSDSLPFPRKNSTCRGWGYLEVRWWHFHDGALCWDLQRDRIAQSVARGS